MFKDTERDCTGYVFKELLTLILDARDGFYKLNELNAGPNGIVFEPMPLDEKREKFVMMLIDPITQEIVVGFVTSAESSFLIQWQAEIHREIYQSRGVIGLPNQPDYVKLIDE